jgi:hypothetical protein
MSENPTAGQGAVLLDIGDEVGALVVSAPAALADAEIEICPAGRRAQEPDEGGTWWVGQWRHDHGGSGHAPGRAWPHVGVVARPGSGHYAVFPGLRAGRYELWVRPGGATGLVADVAGGEVTTAAWPTG